MRRSPLSSACVEGCDPEGVVAIRIRGHFQDIEIKAWHELRAGDTARPCPDVRVAIGFLRDFARDPLSMAALREFASRRLHVSSLYRWSDHEILERIAGHLSAGQFRLVPRDRFSTPFDAGDFRELEDRPPTGRVISPHAPDGGIRRPRPLDEVRAHAPLAPETAPPPIVRPWITFTVIDDETGAPAASVELRLKKPDGTVGTYTTDTAGTVHLTDLPTGTCDLEEVLDGQAFEIVGIEISRS
ncbi:MSCRAMM family protein [Luteimonas salinilitoris]|uniref:Collagen binding domain-containing protein n=1 Tax=Luteimonas salinilitoris TaxID=3237697 RepID=A0ABV4HRL6_9GAMM